MATKKDSPGERTGSGPQRLDDEALYRTVVENAPVTVYIDQVVVRSGIDTPLFISPEIEVLLGWTPEEWIANPSLWVDSLHPEDRARVEGTAEEADDRFDTEYRIKHRDGHWVWVREMARIVETWEGEGEIWHGMFLDIRASKEAEDRLIEAQEQLRSLVDNIPAIVYLDPVDENASSIYVSPKVEQILGPTPEEWITNMSIWREMIHPDDRDAAWDRYVGFRDSGEPLRSEYRMIRKDGRLVWIREEAEILKDEKGNPFLIQGLMHDVTEQKEAEEAREFQARLLESISDAVIATDAEMNVTSWNRAAQVLYGWSSEEMIGNPLPEALRHDPSTLNAIWDPFVEEAQGWRGRTMHRDRDGYEIPIETKGMPLLDPAGNVIGYVMVSREVAES